MKDFIKGMEFDDEFQKIILQTEAVFNNAETSKTNFKDYIISNTKNKYMKGFTMKEKIIYSTAFYMGIIYMNS